MTTSSADSPQLSRGLLTIQGENGQVKWTLETFIPSANTSVATTMKEAKVLQRSVRHGSKFSVPAYCGRRCANKQMFLGQCENPQPKFTRCKKCVKRKYQTLPTIISKGIMEDVIFESSHKEFKEELEVGSRDYQIPSLLVSIPMTQTQWNIA